MVERMDARELATIAEVRRAFTDGRIRAVLRSRDLREAEFARAVGLSPSTLCRYFKGERTPRPAAALRCAAALDLIIPEVRS